jgi:hypothetical protein
LRDVAPVVQQLAHSRVHCGAVRQRGAARLCR